MSDKTRSKKELMEKTSKKIGRFGGGQVKLYSNPVYALRAHRALVAAPKINADGSQYRAVSCPFHNTNTIVPAALTRSIDGLWDYYCNSIDCETRSGKNKLEVLSQRLSLVISGFEGADVP